MLQKIREVLDELEVMAMIFDMEVDIEAGQLVPKSDYKEQFWITRWKEKERGKDADNRFDYDQE